MMTETEVTKELKTVLVVDDDPMHLKIFAWMLKRQGYEVVPAHVQSESVDLRKDKDVDMVLLDYMFKSSLKAPDVARMVKEAHPGAPIIVLSQLEWMPEEMMQFATTFVQKGDPKRLFEHLERLSKEQK